MRDVDHLLGDDAGAGELILGDQLALLAGEHLWRGWAAGDDLVGADIAIVLGLHLAGGDRREAAFGDPGGAHRRQAGFEVDGGGGVGERAGGVIQAERRLVGAGVELDLAERHADIVLAVGREVDLA